MFPNVQKSATGGQKAGNIYRIKNKEVTQKLSLGVLMWHPRKEGLHLGPRNLFQQNYALLTKCNLWPAFIQPHD